MNITHISISRKGVFQECPQRYKYQYHLKLEREGPEPFYFTYGSIVHKIAENFVRSKGQEPINEITEAIITGKRPYDQDREGNDIFCPRLPLEYQKKLPNHIRVLKGLIDKTGTEGWAEWRFELDLDGHGRKVVGVLDRLIQSGDNFFIIDYKTTKKGKYQKTPATIGKDLQLRTYARVVQREFGVKAENIKAALFYVDGGSLVAARFSDADLLAAEQELLTAHKKIQQMKPEESFGNIGWWCKRCDYVQICPYHSITGKGVH